MQSFKQFITEARSKGEEMEEVIVAAVNGTSYKSSSGIPSSAGKVVADFLYKNGIKGEARVLGASQIEVSKTWSRFWEDGKVPSSTKTPKTDIIIGKSKISLKTGGSGQLMSGTKNESLATFYTALEKSKSGITKSVVDKLTNMFEGLAPSSLTQVKGTTGQLIKSGQDEVINKVNAAHKELQEELKIIMKSNPDFQYQFAFEAMSGQTKFGGNDGSCTHFLVTDFDGSNTALHKVSDKAYVKHIADKMNVSVRFKSQSHKITKGGIETKTGKYNYWSVLGLVINKMNEELDTLDSTILTEGAVIDFFKGVWAKVREVFHRAIEYIKENIKNMFEFLEIEPQISFNNTVEF